jgi:hypothetical protein
MKSVWDLCHLDSDTLAEVDKLQSSGLISSAARGNNEVTEVGAEEATSPATYASNSIYGLQSSIVTTEQYCRESLQAVDDILNVLNEISNDFQDVTGRTNSLMMNCENLLEQQVIMRYFVFLLLSMRDLSL